jgi:aerobic-type carbon monoxide dehydrogenase small subunit (CoxS/CutS family)
MSAIDLVSRRPDPAADVIRCTGYHNIVKAVQAGAKTMRR